MGEILDLTKKLPVSPEIITASNMSHEIINVLNKYHGQIRDDLYTGVIADCLAKALRKTQDPQANTAKCLQYIVLRVEQQ